MSTARVGIGTRVLVPLLVLLPVTVSATVASVNLTPSTIDGGSGALATGTVTLAGPAPAGGEVIDLTSSNVALAASTPSITIPEGSTSASFTIGTNPLYRPFSGLAFDVTITATSRGGGSPASAILHVTAQPIPGPFTGGTRSTDQQARDGDICGGAFGSGSAGGESALGNLFRCEFEVAGGFSVCRFLQECEFGCQERVNTIAIGSPMTLQDFCRTSPPAPIAIAPTLVVGGATANGTLRFGEPAPQFSEFQVSSNPPMVSPLGNTPIPQGATSAPFTVRTGEVAVPTFLPLNATVWLSPLFRFDADFLAIVPAPGAPAPAGPLAIFSVSLRPEAVVGGQSELVIATVTLNGVAPSGDVVVSLSTNNPAATVPASVTVRAGRTNAFVSVTTQRVTEPTPVAITATLGGTSRSATLIVNPPSPPVKLLALSLDPPGLVGGSSSTGTVIIGTPAPQGGTAVPLRSSHVIANVPASVTVPAGETRATFPVTTSAVTTSTAVTISGTLNFETHQAFLTVSPTPPSVSISTFSISPASLVGSSTNSATGTVTLTAPAPSGGANVNVSRDSASVFVPAWITVPAGATSATFTINTAPVTSSTVATVTAGYGATNRTATLTLNPIPIASLTVSPSTVVGGESSTGTVTLTAPAPSGGTVVTLSDVGDVTSIPASITIPAGATVGTFQIGTQPVTSTFNANIWARVDNVEKQALLIVQPSSSTPTATLSAVSVSPTSVVGGNAAQGTVTLTGAAPSGGVSVSLSSASSVASVPSSVTVAAGQAAVTFAVSTSTVTTTTSVTISAAAAGTSRTTTLTVTPAAVASVTSAPSLVSPSNRTTVSQPIVFDWSNVTNATQYELQIDTSSSFTAPLTRSVIVTASQATVTDLPAQQLYWRVRGLNTAGAPGPFSSSRRFTARAVTTTTTPSLSALSVSPTSVAGGTAAQGTVTLSAAAPSGGALVTLSSSNTVASVPASVTIPAGATSATFAVTTTSVSASTSSTLTATWGGVSRTATLTVNAPQAAAALSALALNPTTVTGGASSQGTVTLTAAAPSGGAVATLSSSNTAASVPASVTVPAGATSAAFTVSTTAVSASTAVTISGSFGGVTRSATLTVAASAPSQTYTLTVSATGRSGERVTSSPTGISVSVGSTGSASFPASTAITLSVSNGRDAIWSGACSSGGQKQRTCAFSLTGNASVTANVQ